MREVICGKRQRLFCKASLGEAYVDLSSQEWILANKQLCLDEFATQAAQSASAVQFTERGLSHLTVRVGGDHLLQLHPNHNYVDV